MAACLLGDKEVIARATAKLVIKHAGSYMTLARSAKAEAALDLGMVLNMAGMSDYPVKKSCLH